MPLWLSHSFPEVSGNHPPAPMILSLLQSGMGQSARVSRTIAQIACDRVASHLERELDRGQAVITLAELSEETALNPTTAEAVMERLEDSDQFSIRRCGGGEIRWVVQQ